MIIEPKMRGFICLTAHPSGCEKNVMNQIEYVKSKGAINGPKKVLVIGSSTGFGLSSRITSAFGSNASTLGVYFEKGAAPERPASPGWYNTAAFEKIAHEAGLYAKSINGDAFTDEVKQKVIDVIKKDLGTIDLVVYSLAAPRRKHPKTGVNYRSVLKPIGTKFTSKTVDFHSGEVTEVSIDPCTEEEIEGTVAVMGGEDWAMWIDALKDAGVLAENVKTVAYSYIGPKLTESVYRKGTIGKAKDHLEASAFTITDSLKDINGNAYVSVNKALVTQASSAIPVIPLYISILYKIMKKAGNHEGCIEQIQRLFSERIYNGGEVPVDEAGRIRVDDWEMQDDIQAEVDKLWAESTTENLASIGDLEGYRKDFMQLFGFEVEGVDYNEDVEEVVEIPGLVE